MYSRTVPSRLTVRGRNLPRPKIDVLRAHHQHRARVLGSGIWELSVASVESKTAIDNPAAKEVRITDELGNEAGPRSTVDVDRRCRPA